jgi:N-acetylneuraminate synthase
MKQEPFFIADRLIGFGQKPFIIAEIAQAHDGSLGMAHAYIEAVSGTGADAIKFQTHIASEESTLDEPFRIPFSKQDGSRYEYWKRMEFTAEQWKGLAEHAKQRRLIFLSSPFSVSAVELLHKIGMPAWKVGSGEVFNIELLEAMAANRAPILLSTGMMTYAEIENCVELIKGHRLEFCLLQCTSLYPVSLEKVGLNVLDKLREIFICPVGLSDHSGKIFPGLAALASNIDILEVHVVFDRRMFGPDAPASLSVDDLRFLVNARDAFWVMERNPVDKNEIAAELQGVRGIFTRSIAPRTRLEAGTVLREEMIALKKPGTGIGASELKNVLGRRLKRTVTPERLLQWEDIDV